ncbi:sugar phosphate nucleotidyltransferase [Salinirubellus sp. GCM10025818]|jgi:glucose-1-phosphate thymidylyltransferase|uniref:sugar phosphate nucleotidyltransferase n=1 Tax=Salinirubellus TaxID=2162630 RepID=UPI0030D37917
MTIETGVVLAAGEGTRLRPMTHNRPKPMLPAANRPILEHVLDALVDAGVSELVLVVGYKRDRVQDHVGPTYRGLPVEYVGQGKQLGSGHALLQAREAASGSMLVVNGDRIIDRGMTTSVVEAFDGETTIGVVREHNPGRYGSVEVEGDRVVGLIENPDEPTFGFVNAGIYAFTAGVFDRLEATPRTDGELPITDTVLREAESEEGSVRAVEVEGLWADATYPWDLLYLTRRLLEEGRVSGTEQHPGVYVSASARVHETATLQSPVVVGDDCEVGAGAVVGPNVALGRNVTVGANATVVDSVIDTDTRVGVASTLVGTVTGENVDLGAGTVVPGGPGDVTLEDRVFRDRDLGAVFADRVRTGGRVAADPGALVGPGAHLHTGVTVGGRVGAGVEVTR